MKQKRLAAHLLAAAMLLSACGVASGGKHLAVYRAVAAPYRNGGELAVAENLFLSPGVGIINAAISAFNAESSDPGLENPLPYGGRILGYELNGGELRLEAEGCDELGGFDLTLLCCCAVLTFCAIDGIETVSIISGEKSLCSLLSPGDIMLTDISA
ncbi:MAG TPA: hypothetical protein DC001_05010 [Clostridiales bacterium]|nr:hypothetical protein [Clostridiales bacterium]HBR08704.1 hypothetical protein [Clostridiales bacterium]